MCAPGLLASNRHIHSLCTRLGGTSSITLQRPPNSSAVHNAGCQQPRSHPPFHSSLPCHAASSSILLEGPLSSVPGFNPLPQGVALSGVYSLSRAPPRPFPDLQYISSFPCWLPSLHPGSILSMSTPSSIRSPSPSTAAHPTLRNLSHTPNSDGGRATSTAPV